MINTSCRPIYIDTNNELREGLEKAFANTSEAYLFFVKSRRGKANSYSIIARYFSTIEITKSNYLEITRSVERISASHDFYGASEAVITISKAVGLTIPKHHYKSLRAAIKLVLLYLHKFGVAILPYSYTRPWMKWLDNLPQNLSCYTELESRLRSINTHRVTGRDGIPRIKEAERNRWHYTSGMRICLASSWFSPRDITIDDVKSWREYGYSESRNGKSLAIIAVTKIFLYEFPEEIRFTEDTLISELSKTKRAIAASPMDYLIKKFRESSSAETFLGSLIRENTIIFSSLDCYSIYDQKIDDFLSAVSFPYSDALRQWTTQERTFFQFKNYESPKKQHRSIGILNFYLFIYLPAWLNKNPAAPYCYPISPFDFKSTHYDFSNNTPINRPLSFIEFFDACGFTQSYGSLQVYRIFFDHIEFNLPDDIINYKNPVLKLPKSKSYSLITKEIFNGEIFPILIEYCWALESLITKIELDSEISYKAHEKHGRNLALKTEDLGYIPVVFAHGKCHPIDEIISAAIPTFLFNNSPYIHPGIIRFILAQLETGARTQGLQWLDAETYMAYSIRSTDVPQLLNRLYINTDKVNPFGIRVFVLNKVMQLFQRQDNWRLHMLNDIGCKSFGKRLNYDKKENTKFKNILCLFAFNLDNGAPFSDSTYGSIWTWLCYSFQAWHNKHYKENLQLVALIPHKDNRSSGICYSWGDWERAKYSSGIKVEKVRGVPFSPVSLRALVTPHGIRGSFITEYSHVLPPTILSELTGQSAIIVATYNKGHSLLHSKLEGALNHHDVALKPLQELSDKLLSTGEILEGINLAKDTDSLPQAIQELGLISPPVLGIKSGELNGLQIIARERSYHLVDASTHLCVFGLCCPEDIARAFKGVRRCVLCPYAIFSVNNIIRVSAQKNKLLEDLREVKDKLAANQEKMSDADKRQTAMAMDELSREIVSWMVIEESLHAIIQDEGFIQKHKYLTGDKHSVFEQIGRAELRADSETLFLIRLDEIEQLPHFTSEYKRKQMDQMRRYLLLEDGKYIEALSNPPESSSLLAHQLAGLIREHSDNPNFNLSEIIRLSSLSEGEYRKSLVKVMNKKPSLFLE